MEKNMQMKATLGSSPKGEDRGLRLLSILHVLKAVINPVVASRKELGC